MKHLFDRHQAQITQIIQNYLKKFSLYQGEDFFQDVYLILLEKEEKILESHAKSPLGIPLESYLARSVWNICVDLGKGKYALSFRQAQNALSLDEVHKVTEAQEQREKENQEEMLARVHKALSSKKLSKNRLKVELYLQLKNGQEVQKKDLAICFPESSAANQEKCYQALKKAKTEKEKYQVLSQLSGKNYESEQRWLNYQIHKIRELVRS